MFGDEWPTHRTFPNRTIEDCESVSFDGAYFTVIDLGPSESPHDSPWLPGRGRQDGLPRRPNLRHMHRHLADGFYKRWLDNLERLRRPLPPDAVLHVDHGGPVDRDMLGWQARYIEVFVDAVSQADWSDADAARSSVVARVKEYLPRDELQFLMGLSIDPVAGKLGLLSVTVAAGIVKDVELPQGDRPPTSTCRHPSIGR